MGYYFPWKENLPVTAHKLSLLGELDAKRPESCLLYTSEIYGIEYGGSPAENEYVLTVRCSKGTYIRTLLEDIAAPWGRRAP